MPRNVRNFWVELDVDGSKTHVATGPKSSGGGFTMTVLIREKGDISNKVLKIVGIVRSDGRLQLTADLNKQCAGVVTER